jgi:4-hydroxy-tetrahydrodipicolinate synthase
MADAQFVGSGVALVTPFDSKGVNEGVLRELIEFQIAEKTDALIICGSTGEAATMSPEEQKQATEIAVSASRGRVPVVIGCGGSDTAQVERLAKQARAAGADAILVSAPPYNKPPQRGLLLHYRKVMAAGDLPTIIYNVPGRTSVNILPATIEEMCADEHVIGVKEASGDIAQIAELCRRVVDRVSIWSGNDDQIVPILALGGKGVVSVLANVAPRETSMMVHAFLKGDTECGRKLQLKYLPLIGALFAEPNPIPVKTAVGWLGFKVGRLRPPLVESDPDARKKLEAALRDVGLQPRN